MPSNQYPSIAKEAWPILVIIFGILCFLYFSSSSSLTLSLSFILFLFAIYLFRDPFRDIPSQPLAVVSPVHGIVTKVGFAKEMRLNSNAMRIRVLMRFNDIYSL